MLGAHNGASYTTSHLSGQVVAVVGAFDLFDSVDILGRYFVRLPGVRKVVFTYKTQPPLYAVQKSGGGGGGILGQPVWFNHN